MFECFLWVSVLIIVVRFMLVVNVCLDVCFDCLVVCLVVLSIRMGCLACVVFGLIVLL